MNKGDIVTVITVGSEYVGKLKEEVTDKLVLEDPRMVVQSEHGMGFAHGIALTGIEKPTEVVFKDYVFVTPTNDQVISAYREMVSGIITPGSDFTV